MQRTPHDSVNYFGIKNALHGTSAESEKGPNNYVPHKDHHLSYSFSFYKLNYCTQLSMVCDIAEVTTVHMNLNAKTVVAVHQVALHQFYAKSCTAIRLL